MYPSPDFNFNLNIHPPNCRPTHLLSLRERSFHNPDQTKLLNPRHHLPKALANRHPTPKMRGKRSKAYRKLLKQYALAFNFREPWQILVDADLIKDAHRFTMDLPQYLGNTLHGEVKILVTQCSMRHLYAQNKDGSLERVIDKAKGLERRRCGHHPEQYPEPLSTAECLASVVGATNKHRYVVASQEYEVRALFRQIPGVPLVYISRSVMIVSAYLFLGTNVCARACLLAQVLIIRDHVA